MKKIEEDSKGMTQQLAGHPTSLMPHVPRPRLLYVKLLGELPDDRLNDAPQRNQQARPFRVLLDFGIRPRGRLQIHPFLPEIVLQSPTEIPFVCQDQILNPGHDIPEGLSFIGVGQRQSEPGNDAGKADQEMAFKPVVRFFLGSTVAIGDVTSKEFGKVRSRKTTNRDRKTVNDMNWIRKGPQFAGQGLLHLNFQDPEIGRLPGKSRATGKVGKPGQPMPTEILPDPFVRVDAQEFPHDLHREDFRIGQAWRKPAGTPALSFLA